MAGFGSFLKGVADYSLKQNERKQEEEAYKRKLELANKLSIQLEQRKMELAKQFPTYAKFATTATGDVIGIDQFGRSKSVYQPDAETKSLLSSAKQAKILEDQSQASKNKAQLDLYRAQTDLTNERRNNPQKFFKEGAPKKPGNLLTAGQSDSSYMQWLYQNGEPITDDVTGRVTRVPLPDTPENQAKWRKSISQRGLLLPGGGFSEEPEEAADPGFDMEDFSQALPNMFLED